MQEAAGMTNTTIIHMWTWDLREYLQNRDACGQTWCVLFTMFAKSRCSSPDLQNRDACHPHMMMEILAWPSEETRKYLAPTCWFSSDNDIDIFLVSSTDMAEPHINNATSEQAVLVQICTVQHSWSFLAFKLFLPLTVQNAEGITRIQSKWKQSVYVMIESNSMSSK